MDSFAKLLNEDCVQMFLPRDAL